MSRRSWLIFALGLLTILLHLLPLLGRTGLFGVDALAYLPLPFSLAWCGFAVILLFPPLAEHFLLKDPPALPTTPLQRPWHKTIPGQIAFSVLMVLLALACLPLSEIISVATPLLGDGLDRIEALPDGWKSLAGQPAPLDLSIHVLLFQYLGYHWGKTAFWAAWSTYRFLSFAAGFLALCAWKALARRWGQTRWERALLFAGWLGMGSSLLFLGYPENYSILAAMLFVHLWLLEQTLEAKRSPLWPLLSLLALIGLHFFCLLLLPPTFYVLFRSGRWRPSRTTSALLLAVGAAFLVFLFLTVERRFRGTAIFLPPGQIFSLSRLLEFFNEQLLVCPALLLLLPWAFASGRRSPIGDYLAGASLLWVPFFYVLRPVIGAGPDWDLFALPALVYTPWLFLRARATIFSGTRSHYLAWAILVVSLFHTIPWVVVNAGQESAVARYHGLMTDLEGKNPWAAGYGWLKLGKYRQRLGQTDQALAAYDRSLAANPGYSVLYREIGEKMLELGRLDLAVQRFQGFLQHNPTSPEAKPALAQARKLYALDLEGRGRFPEAAAQDEAILQLYPDNREAQAALARVREKMAAGAGR